MAVVVGATCTTPTDLVPIFTIQLQPQLDSIELGQTYSRWLVTLQDAAGKHITGRTLTWESSNPGVLTVDANGIVSTVGPIGEAFVIVRSGGKSATSTIRVLTPILSIVASPDSFDLPLTTSRLIAVQLVGPGGLAITNRVIEWSSSSPNVAVVSTSGLVTAVSQGSTTISIRAGTKQIAVRVRVIAEPVSSVRITPSQAVHVIRLGQVKQLNAECLSASQQVLTGRVITWNSSNPVAASVGSTGLVSAASIGSATISATCDNTVSGSTTAQVTPVPVSTVSISPVGLTIAQGSQGQLLVTARDSANNVLSLQGRTVVWTSNNNPVAQVSGQGVVAGMSIGSAEITVSVDGVVGAPVPVTVTAPMFSLTSATQRGVLLKH